MKNQQPEPERSCGWVPRSAAGSEPAAPLEQCNRQSRELWKWTKGLLLGNVTLSSILGRHSYEKDSEAPALLFFCTTDLTWSFLLRLWFYWFKAWVFRPGPGLGSAQRYKLSNSKVRLYRKRSSQQSPGCWIAFRLIVLFYCILMFFLSSFGFKYVSFTEQRQCVCV